MSSSLAILVAFLSLHPGGPRREQQAGWEEMLVSRGVARPLLGEMFPGSQLEEEQSGQWDGKGKSEHPWDLRSTGGCVSGCEISQWWGNPAWRLPVFPLQHLESPALTRMQTPLTAHSPDVSPPSPTSSEHTPSANIGPTLLSLQTSGVICSECGKHNRLPASLRAQRGREAVIAQRRWPLVRQVDNVRESTQALGHTWAQQSDCFLRVVAQPIESQSNSHRPQFPCLQNRLESCPYLMDSYEV